MCVLQTRVHASVLEKRTKKASLRKKFKQKPKDLKTTIGLSRRKAFQVNVPNITCPSAATNAQWESD